jgi:hypothetical protein
MLFLVLYRAWFHLIGGVAVIGAAWVIQEYKN